MTAVTGFRAKRSLATLARNLSFAEYVSLPEQCDPRLLSSTLHGGVCTEISDEFTAAGGYSARMAQSPGTSELCFR